MDRFGGRCQFDQLFGNAAAMEIPESTGAAGMLRIVVERWHLPRDGMPSGSSHGMESRYWIQYASHLTVRSLSAVETVAIIATVGSVVAVTVPAFVSNLRASRLSEPVEALSMIARNATLYAVGRPARLAYPDSVGLTPARVPAGQRVTDAPGTWDHHTWRRLDFRMNGPHGFCYEFESHKAGNASAFSVRAHGDLDGDGVTSTFEITGASRDSEEPTIGELRVHREVE